MGTLVHRDLEEVADPQVVARPLRTFEAHERPLSTGMGVARTAGGHLMRYHILRDLLDRSREVEERRHILIGDGGEGRGMAGKVEND